MPSQVKTFALLTGLRGGASHQTATSAKVSIQCKEKEPVRVAFDVQRPTGFSALTKIWTP